MNDLADALASGRETDLAGVELPAAELVALLTASAPPGAPALRLRRATVTGALRLSGARVGVPVELRECTFAHVPDLRMAELAGLALTGSRLPGLRAGNLRVAADLLLDDGFDARGPVDLTDAQIGGSLRLSAGRLRAGWHGRPGRGRGHLLRPTAARRRRGAAARRADHRQPRPGGRRAELPDRRRARPHRRHRRRQHARRAARDRADLHRTRDGCGSRAPASAATWCSPAPRSRRRPSRTPPRTPRKAAGRRCCPPGSSTRRRAWWPTACTSTATWSSTTACAPPARSGSPTP